MREFYEQALSFGTPALHLWQGLSIPCAHGSQRALEGMGRSERIRHSVSASSRPWFSSAYLLSSSAVEAEIHSAF